MAGAGGRSSHRVSRRVFTVSKCAVWVPQGVFLGGLAYLALAAAAAPE